MSVGTVNPSFHSRVSQPYPSFGNPLRSVSDVGPRVDAIERYLAQNQQNWSSRYNRLNEDIIRSIEAGQMRLAPGESILDFSRYYSPEQIRARLSHNPSLAQRIIEQRQTSDLAMQQSQLANRDFDQAYLAELEGRQANTSENVFVQESARLNQEIIRVRSEYPQLREHRRSCEQRFNKWDNRLNWWKNPPLLLKPLAGLFRWGIGLFRNKAAEALQDARQSEQANISTMGSLQRRYGLVGQRTQLDTQDSRLTNRWPRNTQVLASSGQDQVTYVQAERNQDRMTMFLDALGRCNTIDEAHRAASQGTIARPLMGHQPCEHPVQSSQGTQGWDQRERRPRRVLVFIGPTSSRDPHSDGAVLQDHRQRLVQMTKDRYGVTDDNIEVVENCTPEAMQQAFQRMREFSSRNPGAEALVAVLGHGSTDGVEAGLPQQEAHRQGALRGYVHIGNVPDGRGGQRPVNLTEDQLKAYFNTYMADFHSAKLFMTACHSGAFVAQADRPNPRDREQAAV